MVLDNLRENLDKEASSLGISPSDLDTLLGNHIYDGLVSKDYHDWVRDLPVISKGFGISEVEPIVRRAYDHHFRHFREPPLRIIKEATGIDHGFSQAQLESLKYSFDYGGAIFRREESSFLLALQRNSQGNWPLPCARNLPLLIVRYSVGEERYRMEELSKILI